VHVASVVCTLSYFTDHFSGPGRVLGLLAFSALTMLVGRQEEHLACNK